MLYLRFLKFIVLFWGNLLGAWSFFGNTPTLPITPEPVKKLTLIIDPGDHNYSGRTIEDQYERSIASMCAQQIKQILENHMPQLQVIITRNSGESDELENNQHISFANRTNPDLYISLHFYYTPEEQSTVWLYYLLYNPITDCWHKKNNTLNFYTYSIAHCPVIDQTKKIGVHMLEVLQKQENKNHIIYPGLYGIPFKPLAGLTSCALACEVGLSKKNSWKSLVDPLAQAIERALELINSEKINT
jgi:N-acetylmuramoyl-L-alanine amidase